jgi:hypothetical protein
MRRKIFITLIMFSSSPMLWAEICMEKLASWNEQELLQYHAAIIKELKQRKVVRTSNNPLGDYTEWLVSKSLALNLASNSEKGYDAIDKKGIKYQIKGRRITPNKKSRQLSAIRNLNSNTFDFLVGVVFDQDYSVIDAVIIPHSVIPDYSTYQKHTNSHIIRLQGKVLKDPRVKHIHEALNY